MWYSSTPDPSFFWDASIELLPPFDITPILELMKFLAGHNERTLPWDTRATVPTTDKQVQERSQSVWNMKDRTLEASRTLEKRDGSRS